MLNSASTLLFSLRCQALRVGVTTTPAGISPTLTNTPAASYYLLKRKYPQHFQNQTVNSAPDRERR